MSPDFIGDVFARLYLKLPALKLHKYLLHKLSKSFKVKTPSPSVSKTLQNAFMSKFPVEGCKLKDL